MKRLLFTFALILLTASIATAQEKGASFAIEGETVHDFGEVKEADGPATHTFIVKNEGDAPLIISRIVPACGCTLPEWTKEPIAPGKTGEIKVSYDTKNRPGPIGNKSVSVYSNGHTGSIVLYINGTVIPNR